MRISDRISGVCSSDLNWKPADDLTLTGGRIAYPFHSTDLFYTSDLNFDGVAAIFNRKLNQDWGLFGTVGAFPVEYTNDTSTSNGSDKEESDNKWLYGAQLGAKWAINDSNRVKEIGRAHVGTPVTNAHIECRLLLEKKKD